MSVAHQRILVVDGEEASRAETLRALDLAGFPAEGVADGRDAAAIAATSPLGAVLTEVAVPGLSGFELCRRLRASALNADVPILIVSCSDSEVDRVVAFELGADDYVIKPYSPRELPLRVRAVMRRFSARPVTPVPSAAGIELDAALLRATVSGNEVPLTVTEFRLLAALALREGAVVSRAALLREVWDLRDDTGTRTLDTHMKRLRGKLRPLNRHVETVRGVGYRIRPSAA